MDRNEALAESLATLTTYLVGDSSIGDTVQRVVELAESAFSQSAMTGITTMVDDRPQTAFFTNTEAPDIDQAQYDQGTGPCVDAFRQGTVFIIDSTAEDDRWPEFCDTAHDHGILSTLSIPMIAGGASIGALNFYARTESAFDVNDVFDAKAFAAQASAVLSNSQAYWEAHDLGLNMRGAMEYRSVIEQAKGILMAQSQVDPDTAFDLLRRASQRENRKLRDIAIEMVERTVTGKTPPFEP